MAFLVPRQPLTPSHRLAAGISPGAKIVRAGELFAFRSAEEIVAEASDQSDRILAETESAFQQERQRGYQEGHEAAQLEQSEQMIENIGRTVDYFARVEGQMVELVMRAVRKIIEGFDDDERVLIAVKSALSVVRNQKQITLRTHPHQTEIVRARVNEVLAAYPGIGYLDIVADSRLKADACIVETEIGTVEASLEGQIEALRTAFEKVLGSRI